MAEHTMRLSPRPGDRFTDSAAQGLVGREVTVETGTYRVAGQVVAARVDGDGDLCLTVESPEPLTPSFGPFSMS